MIVAKKLSNADILKSSNLEKIEDGSEMNEYAREWENMQEDLGNDFDRFLAYVRTMLLKKRQKTNLLDEYEKRFLKQEKSNREKIFSTMSLGRMRIITSWSTWQAMKIPSIVRW